MTTIPTAEEYFNKRSEELGFVNWTNVIVNQEWDIIELLPIEFTKLHVTEALKLASYNVDLCIKDVSKCPEDGYRMDTTPVENCYPLTNIK